MTSQEKKERKYLKIQEKVGALIAEGYSQRYLAKKFGVSRMVIRWCLPDFRLKHTQIVKDWRRNNPIKLLEYQRKKFGRVVCPLCRKVYSTKLT